MTAAERVPDGDSCVGRWVVTFRRQGCIDDGGIGHDDYWSQPRTHALTTKATTDEGAIRAAQRWIRTQSGKHPCGSFGCSNRGLVRMERVEFVVPEKRREAVARG